MEFERPETWLTEKDRRYLKQGELPDKRQSRYQRKKDVRRRIKDGLLNFPAIRVLPRDERRRIFSDMEQGDDLYHALVCGMSLAKLACDDARLDFEQFLEEALVMAEGEPRTEVVGTEESEKNPQEPEARSQLLQGFDVNITANYSRLFNLTRIRKQFLDGEKIDPVAMVKLVQSEEFDQKVFDELRRRRERDPDRGKM